MDFGRPDLKQVMCPFADTLVKDGTTGHLVPSQACLVFVRRLPPADRDVLAELLPDDWGERVRWILSECVCDGMGVRPPPELLAEVFSRFDLETTERVHRTCCAENGLPYLEFPRDERPEDGQPA